MKDQISVLNPDEKQMVSGGEEHQHGSIPDLMENNGGAIMAGFVGGTLALMAFLCYIAYRRGNKIKA